MSWTTVETWLESIGLQRYTQAFIDNGYDELDICRQIGQPDLDAIGVTECEDRDGLLAAVSDLQQSPTNTSVVTSGGSASNEMPVYFTLENPDTTALPSNTHQLSTLVSERLADDDISLTRQPYISQVQTEQFLIYTVYKRVNPKCHKIDTFYRLSYYIRRTNRRRK